MEYFIGSAITLIAIVCIKLIASKLPFEKTGGIRQSQSYIYNLIEQYLPEEPYEEDLFATQATKYLDQVFVRVVFVDGKAYWVENNRLYVANHEDHEVDKSQAVEVDTMGMDKVQLNNIMLVVEKLKEGAYDDNWNAG